MSEMAKFKALRHTALYERLSKDDELKGEFNSISNQDEICQGVFLPKYIKATMRELWRFRIVFYMAII